MGIAALALAGFPLTSGYLSKDGIVISAYEWASHLGSAYILIPVVLIIVSLLTAFYIGRLIFKTFFGTFKYRTAQKTGIPFRDAPTAMLIPMLFLVVGCLFPLFGQSPLDYHLSWITRAFHVEVAFPTVAKAHIVIPALLTGGALLAWLIGWRWYVQHKYPLSENNKWVHFARQQGYMNEFNERVFVRSTLWFSRVCYIFDHYVVDGLTKLFAWFTRQLSVVVHWIDKNIVDGIVNLAAQTAYYIGHLVRHVQNGQLQGYLGFALTIVVLGILYLIIK